MALMEGHQDGPDCGCVPFVSGVMGSPMLALWHRDADGQELGAHFNGARGVTEVTRKTYDEGPELPSRPSHASDDDAG